MAGVGQGLDWGPPIGAIGIPVTHTAIFRVDYHLMIGSCAPQTNKKKKILMSVCYIKHSCQILTAATVCAKISVSGKTFWRKKCCISKT